jgi:hypothetical protein
MDYNSSSKANNLSFSKFPHLLWNTRAYYSVHWTLSWVRLIWSKSSHPVYLRSVLILSSCVTFGPTAGIPSCFPTEALHAFFMCATYAIHRIPLLFNQSTEYKEWGSSLRNFLRPDNFVWPRILLLYARSRYYSFLGLKKTKFYAHIEQQQLTFPWCPIRRT